MTEEKAGKKTTAKSDNVQPTASNGLAIESFLPTGSPQRTVAGIAAAAGGALIAATVLGLGPAALAGAAGYLAYREISRGREPEERE
jgi:hypothetical protein